MERRRFYHGITLHLYPSPITSRYEKTAEKNALLHLMAYTVNILEKPVGFLIAPNSSSFEISDVSAQSVAAKNGISVGDTLSEVNGQPFSDIAAQCAPKDPNYIVWEMEPPFTLTLLRNGAHLTKVVDQILDEMAIDSMDEQDDEMKEEIADHDPESDSMTLDVDHSSTSMPISPSSFSRSSAETTISIQNGTVTLGPDPNDNHHHNHHDHNHHDHQLHHHHDSHQHEGHHHNHHGNDVHNHEPNDFKFDEIKHDNDSNPITSPLPTTKLLVAPKSNLFIPDQISTKIEVTLHNSSEGDSNFNDHQHPSLPPSPGSPSAGSSGSSTSDESSIVSSTLSKQLIERHLLQGNSLNPTVHFDIASLTKSNGKICAVSSLPLRSGTHEWTLEIVKCDVEIQVKYEGNTHCVM